MLKAMAKCNEVLDLRRLAPGPRRARASLAIRRD
jgi:hypothetical protein